MQDGRGDEEGLLKYEVINVGRVFVDRLSLGREGGLGVVVVPDGLRLALTVDPRTVVEALLDGLEWYLFESGH